MTKASLEELERVAIELENKRRAIWYAEREKPFSLEQMEAYDLYASSKKLPTLLEEVRDILKLNEML